MGTAPKQMACDYVFRLSVDIAAPIEVGRSGRATGA